ncbi:hypothetical protein GYH30_011738 [Glycine max]|nr:hypothetical protein GYH30_011738 [Glycine max]
MSGVKFDGTPPVHARPPEPTASQNPSRFVIGGFHEAVSFPKASKENAMLSVLLDCRRGGGGHGGLGWWLGR